MRNAYKLMVGKPEGKTQIKRPRHHGKIILEWILERQSGKVWNGCI
jgi:hypothetical protein